MLTATHPLEFDVIENFGNLPDYIKLGITHGICVDIEDNVYVFNRSECAVLCFDKHGTFIRSWGSEFMHGAHGMRITREGLNQYLYLTDEQRHEVVKLTLRGLEQLRLGMPPRLDIYSTPNDFKPTDVCVAPTGDICVCDGHGKPFVHVYDRHGKLKKTIGGAGSGEGQFNHPHGAWIDTRHPDPELYVADQGNSRIQVFALDGTFKRTITHPELTQPSGFYEYRDELWVADRSGKLVVLDPHDQVVSVVTAGFVSPHACCVDSNGDVYVVENTDPGKITKLKRRSPNN